MRIFSLSQMSKVKLVSTLPWREKIADGNRLHPFPWRGEGPWVGVEAFPYEGKVGWVGTSKPKAWKRFILFVAQFIT